MLRHPHIIMKIFLTRKGTTLLILFFYILIGKSYGLTASPSSNRELSHVVEKIKQSSKSVIAKFKGIDYKRDLTITETDSKTGSQISVSKISTRRVEYYYERPVIVVLSYVKNGENLPPKDYEPEKTSPTYPIFDDQSEDHYSIQIQGPILFKNRESYVVEVTPLQLSPRHFKGKIYYDKNSLHPYYIEGTTSKWKFGVKDLYFKINMELTPDKVAIVRSGEVFVKTHIPLLSPEKNIHIRLETLEAVPIRK
ncbi:hypothetical protein [Leptospira adleri]|uniref:hypothetical protein n=1 Tax=Leptospira adleri TaxID=2023186 RepID=UPI0010842CB4|nr:hypothetical protein [Leptospira adleri]TGM53532.1 hypothetical protein EHQ97_16825 [Leptospira adleri]